ncbi:hypothetical protein GFS31_08080 [Leptolyngbya sp. BL0902]|nr:hypothetical protein GFS31_08080 [Leptolyngbya sp. BL0902]
MLSELLRRTALRYLKAKEMVMAEHPDVPQEEFDKLVGEAVKRLASQEVHLENDDPKRADAQSQKTPGYRR